MTIAVQRSCFVEAGAGRCPVVVAEFTLGAPRSITEDSPMTINFPFAFILVKFTDDPTEPISPDRARTLFTKVGRGGMYVVDWFDDNTHHKVDIGESQVFGWFPLQESSTDYNAKRAAGADRSRILDLGRQAATAARVNLAAFSNVAVITNVEVDLFGSAAGVVATAASANKQYWEVQVAPSVLCQELIHGLGVPQHTRRVGSDDDYTDPYDVMSMFNATPGHHPSEPSLPIGPGLNSAFMDRAGWLDTSRVLTKPMRVDLRPLHRLDLPGYLAAQVGNYYIEYRPRVGWDSGLPEPFVFVHTRENDTSYLVKELRSDQGLSIGDPRGILDDYFSLTVDSIDDSALTATVTIDARSAWRPVAGPAEVFGGVAADGGGFIIIGGKIIKIPPRSPAMKVLEGLAMLEAVRSSTLPAHLAHRMTVEVLETLSSDLTAEIGELKDLHTPKAREAQDG
jgi:hypothetical protein